ncbi:MAG: lysophospholipid acyltransferase family protein [Eubacterium sp.]
MYNYNQYENKRSEKHCFRILHGLAKCLFRIEIRGEENIPEANFILSTNHTSMIDFILVTYSKKLPPVHFMAKSELFDNPFERMILSKINCFPVERGNGKSAQALTYAVNLLKKGFNLAIFPEGKINSQLPYFPGEAKSGISRIACAADALILPCSIYFSGRLLPFKKIIVSYGEPISCSKMQSDLIDNEYEYHKSNSAYIFEQTKALWKDCSEYVQSV